MGEANTALTGNNRFTTSLGNKQLNLQLDADGAQLTIELANASRFVVHRRTISKPEEVREITGAPCFIYSAIWSLILITVQRYHFLSVNTGLFACN